MAIKSVEMFAYRGKVFPTEAKALDYAESLIADEIKAATFAKGFTLTEWVKISEVILAHRGMLRELMDF